MTGKKTTHTFPTLISIYMYIYIHSHTMRHGGEERDILVKTAFMDHSHLHKEEQLY